MAWFGRSVSVDRVVSVVVLYAAALAGVWATPTPLWWRGIATGAAGIAILLSLRRPTAKIDASCRADPTRMAAAGGIVMGRCVAQSADRSGNVVVHLDSNATRRLRIRLRNHGRRQSTQRHADV